MSGANARRDAPRTSARTLAQELDGETVLIQIDTGIYYTLDEVGSRVWVLCDGDHSRDQIVSAVAAEFDGPRSEIEGDIGRLLAELVREGLVVEAD